MKRPILQLALLIIVWIGCTPPQVTTLPNTDDQCQLTAEICREAADFQRDFDRMPPDEQADMTAILNNYAQLCREATKACKQWSRKR
jgi:hypothetical protein